MWTWALDLSLRPEGAGIEVGGVWGASTSCVRAMPGQHVPGPLNKGPPERRALVCLIRALGTLCGSKFVPGVVLTRCGEVTDMMTTIFEESLYC